MINGIDIDHNNSGLMIEINNSINESVIINESGIIKG
jgi:hypothetical protein